MDRFGSDPRKIKKKFISVSGIDNIKRNLQLFNIEGDDMKECHKYYMKHFLAPRLPSILKTMHLTASAVNITVTFNAPLDSSAPQPQTVLFKHNKATCVTCKREVSPGAVKCSHVFLAVLFLEHTLTLLGNDSKDQMQ